MKAGRELDVLIAEKVLGLKRSGDLFARAEWPKHYSTDIAAAWEVVEKLGRHSLRLYAPCDEAPSWMASFCVYGYRPFQDQTWKGYADTAPHAISLAALKAVE